MKTNKFGDIFKDYIIPVFLVIVTGILGTFLFNKIDKLDERIYNMNEKVIKLETSVGELTTKIGEFRSTVVDNYDELNKRVLDLERK